MNHSGWPYNPDTGAHGPACIIKTPGLSAVVCGVGLPYSWHISTFVVFQEVARGAVVVPPDPTDPPANDALLTRIAVALERQAAALEKFNAHIGVPAVNKGALHYQEIPGWAKQLKQGRAFLIDPPGDNPFPGAIVYGRTYMNDNESNALVMMGEAGAEMWFAKFKDQYERAKYIEAWCTPNEPPVDTLLKRQMLTRFMIRFAQLMHGIGRKVVGFNFSVWWPDLGTAMDFAPAIPYLDYIGFHEYGYPRMATDMPGRKCLHYRQVWAEWVAGGVKNIPPFIIDESGEDDGQKHGWKTFAKEESVYLADLQWYANEVAKDDYVLAFFVFTAGPQGWYDFEITETLGKAIASPVAFVPPVVPPPPTVPDFFATLKAAFGTQAVDLRATLPTRGSYPNRPLSAIKRIVVHHTVAPSSTPWSVIANYHVNSRAYPGIAYHIGVGPDGTVSLLNSLTAETWHCGTTATPEDDNLDTIGVCVAGNFHPGQNVPTEQPTAAALASLRKLLPALDSHLGIACKVIGHRDIAPNLTACPGDNLYPYVATLREVTIGPDAGELLAAGDQYRLIKLNPDAALQKRILHDGFVPTSNEFDYADQRKQPPVYYVGQQAERLSDKIVRVYYCRVNDWANVRYVER